jgi:hypothetical protein
LGAADYFRELPPLVLDEQTRVHRRNLLVALGVVTCYYVVGITPGGFSAAFVSGTFQRPQLVELFLWFIVFYELIMFHLARTVDDINFYSKHEHHTQFKMYLCYAQMRVALAHAGFQVTVDKEHRNARTDYGPNEKITASFRLSTITPPAELRNQSREEWLSAIKALRIPGLSASTLPGYELDYVNDDEAEVDRYLRKAFPRIRRLTASEFMLVWFPYWAVLASVVVRCMAIAVPWATK